MALLKLSAICSEHNPSWKMESNIFLQISGSTATNSALFKQQLLEEWNIQRQEKNMWMAHGSLQEQTLRKMPLTWKKTNFLVCHWCLVVRFDKACITRVWVWGLLFQEMMQLNFKSHKTFIQKNICPFRKLLKNHLFSLLQIFSSTFSSEVLSFLLFSSNNSTPQIFWNPNSKLSNMNTGLMSIFSSPYPKNRSGERPLFCYF